MGSPHRPAATAARLRAAAELAALPNLGPRSAAVLVEAGIGSAATLRRLGAVKAYVRAKQHGSAVSLNLLWALEGAIAGLPWQQVARERRTDLLLALDDEMRARR
jgi:DNA transformation protein